MVNPFYNKKVLRRFSNPKFFGEIENADGIGQVGNSACGDIMRVYLKVGKNKNKKAYIKNVKFKTMGCVAAISSSDAVCEIAKGKTIEEAKKISREDILNTVGDLPQIKHHCSILGEEASLKAIKNYEERIHTDMPKRRFK